MEMLKGAKASWIWLALRLYVGYQWLTSGWGKLNNPAWMDSGEAILAFWKRAVAIPETGRPPITYDWYRGFIQGLIDGGHHTWFGKLIPIGEFLVGLALILGAFTIFAAVMGALMNWAFIMAGTASSNGMLLVLSFFIIAGGGAYAGYLGLDYYLRPIYRKFMDTRVWRRRTAAGRVA